MMTNPYKGRAGLERMQRATSYSIDGLKTAYRGESAFRLALWLALALLQFTFWLGRNCVEIALLAGSLSLVLFVELLMGAARWHRLPA